MSNQISPVHLASMLGDWISRTKALYRDLAARLEALVLEGDLAPDTLLPPERALAAALVVSRTTVAAAYDVLRRKRLVDTRHGSGTWVRANATAPAADSNGRAFPWPNLLRLPPLKSDPTQPDVIGLLSSDVAASSVLVEVAGSMTQRDWLTVTSDEGYCSAGLSELRVAIARDLTARGLRTSPAEILVTTGAQQALHLVSLCS